ncbi:MAG TPA: molybdate ABC transporter substrate-binding protein [Kofleriaceae bacterium]|nr:molybdate ABC transporter substrate-binding protein [Kofleriaceae bacterium]
MWSPRRPTSPAHALVALVALAAFCVAPAAGCRRHARGTVRIAAAADLGAAFEELGKKFTAHTGLKPVFTFGSSGLLAKQLAEGAPYQVFAAANQSYIDDLVAKGRCDGGTRRIYARGRLVVWSKWAAIDKLADLTAPAIQKIAIANPEHAPYGVAAQQALRASELWDQVQGKMVYAENVRQAMQWAQDGQADAAIVAMSLAVVTEGGRSLVVNPALHAPLDQAIALCGDPRSETDGARFLDELASPEGRELMERYGFILPPEQR